MDHPTRDEISGYCFKLDTTGAARFRLPTFFDKDYASGYFIAVIEARPARSASRAVWAVVQRARAPGKKAGGGGDNPETFEEDDRRGALLAPKKQL